jgi:hypothetical protein
MERQAESLFQYDPRPSGLGYDGPFGAKHCLWNMNRNDSRAMTPDPASNFGIAPADAVPHRPWPAWRKIAAYLLLAALASVSIWFIDRGAMDLLYSPHAITP